MTTELEEFKKLSGIHVSRCRQEPYEGWWRVSDEQGNSDGEFFEFEDDAKDHMEELKNGR